MPSFIHAFFSISTMITLSVVAPHIHKNEVKKQDKIEQQAEEVPGNAYGIHKQFAKFRLNTGASASQPAASYEAPKVDHKSQKEAHLKIDHKAELKAKAEAKEAAKVEREERSEAKYEQKVEAKTEAKIEKEERIEAKHEEKAENCTETKQEAKSQKESGLEISADAKVKLGLFAKKEKNEKSESDRAY